jgi:hypothetical protein
MKRDALEHLISKARQAPPPGMDGSVEAPLGFATRVVARAGAPASESWFYGIERRAWRVLGVAGTLAALTLTLNLSAMIESYEQQILDDYEDPVTEVWNL